MNLPCIDCITFALCKARLTDYLYVFSKPTAVRQIADTCSLLHDFIIVMKEGKKFGMSSYIKIDEVIDYYDNYSM